MYKYDSFNEAYYRIVEDVVANGTKYVPRGHRCIELRPGQFRINDAWDTLYTGSDRRLNYRFFALETLSYLAGWGLNKEHAELLCAVNKGMKSFVNPTTGTFDGAYGTRLRQSLPMVTGMLKADPFCRQAVASIWQPGLPVPKGSKDTPCTIALHFFMEGSVVQPRLSMMATMRSNDLNWGTPYDVPAFAAIQIAIADCLGWSYGSYNHSAGSLHVYEETMPTLGHLAGTSHANVVQPRWEDDGIVSGRPKMYQIIHGADAVLKDAYQHLQSGKPWSEFRSAMELINEYWAMWGRLIRFNWKAWDQGAC